MTAYNPKLSRITAKLQAQKDAEAARITSGLCAIAGSDDDPNVIAENARRARLAKIEEQSQPPVGAGRSYEPDNPYWLEEGIYRGAAQRAISEALD